MFSSVVSPRIIEGLFLCHRKTDRVFIMSWVQIWRLSILGVFGIVFASVSGLFHVVFMVLHSWVHDVEELSTMGLWNEIRDICSCHFALEYWVTPIIRSIHCHYYLFHSLVYIYIVTSTTMIFLTCWHHHSRSFNCLSTTKRFSRIAFVSWDVCTNDGSTTRWGCPSVKKRRRFFGGKCLQILLVKHLGGGFKDFLFSPLPGEMIQFD